MNAPTLILPPAELGAPFEGGFYSGRIRVDEQVFALIAAPKIADVVGARWHKNTKPVTAATSFCDGLANTHAMAAAGSPLAKTVLDLETAGFVDWYLPSRDELELLYRAFKPTGATNWCYRGDNPSSVPVGYAYSPDSPAQTAVDAFRAGGTEAFGAEWYWSSTQYAGFEDCAWAQYFDNGSQDACHKGNSFRARPVRRLPL